MQVSEVLTSWISLNKVLSSEDQHNQTTALVDTSEGIVPDGEEKASGRGSPLAGVLQGMGKVGEDVLQKVGAASERVGLFGEKLLDIFDLNDVGGDIVEMKDKVGSDMQQKMKLEARSGPQEYDF
mmetsp:Transcript_18952/g.38515  ORF Transcript_18952/g.38515 Transcript_18952/m.38515 type:complete len:125 (-) Transcript_18952:72-446(-)